jgi:hypothetical protein
VKERSEFRPCINVILGDYAVAFVSIREGLLTVYIPPHLLTLYPFTCHPQYRLKLKSLYILAPKATTSVHASNRYPGPSYYDFKLSCGMSQDDNYRLAVLGSLLEPDLHLASRQQGSHMKFSRAR